MNVSQAKANSVIEAITRKQLRGLGASRYHAIKVTERLSPIDRQGNSYLYPINEVITSIRTYRERPRLKPETHTKLETVLDTLSSVLGNVAYISSPNKLGSPTNQFSQQLLQAMSKTDTALATLKLDAAEIKSEYALSGD